MWMNERPDGGSYGNNPADCSNASEIDKLTAELAAAKAEVKNTIGERDGAMKLYSEECDTTEQLEATVERLRTIIENAKRETQGWTTGGYPDHFARLAVILYHALDDAAGRGEEKK